VYNNLTQKNHVNFWKTWHRKSCSSNSKPANCVNGQTGDANILNEFTNYFKLVGKPNTADADVAFKNEVDTLLSDASTASNNISTFVDCHLMQECILQLKTGKAVSFDGIYNEHIIYGYSCLNVHFCLLFNALLRHGVVPSDFCSVVIILLLKGKHGNPSNFDMYRGITIAPAASKLFELILLWLYDEFLYSSVLKRIVVVQLLFLLLLKRLNISINLARKSVVLFLDASKAFDKVIHNGLFLNLINRNVPVGFVRLMRNWYSRLCCMVRWNGITGAAFPDLCGVRQGGILSPILFAIFVDSLISDLRQSGYGLYILAHYLWGALSMLTI